MKEIFKAIGIIALIYAFGLAFCWAFFRLAFSYNIFSV